MNQNYFFDVPNVKLLKPYVVWVDEHDVIPQSDLFSKTTHSTGSVQAHYLLVVVWTSQRHTNRF